MKQTDLEMGTLPIRYLSVPLVIRNLTHRDCTPLIEKITQRIRSWTAKCPSFDERLQLIQPVIF